MSSYCLIIHLIVNSLQIRLCQHSSIMRMLHLRPEGMEKNTSHIKDSIYMQNTSQMWIYSNIFAIKHQFFECPCVFAALDSCFYMNALLLNDIQAIVLGLKVSQ